MHPPSLLLTFHRAWKHNSAHCFPYFMARQEESIKNAWLIADVERFFFVCLQSTHSNRPILCRLGISLYVFFPSWERLQFSLYIAAPYSTLMMFPALFTMKSLFCSLFLMGNRYMVTQTSLFVWNKFIWHSSVTLTDN